jgi:hypothetical protein
MIFWLCTRFPIAKFALQSLKYSNSRSLKKLLMIAAEKQGFKPEKAGKVMTVDHHDRELCRECYFKPCLVPY